MEVFNRMLTTSLGWIEQIEQPMKLLRHIVHGSEREDSEELILHLARGKDAIRSWCLQEGLEYITVHGRIQRALATISCAEGVVRGTECGGDTA